MRHLRPARAEESSGCWPHQVSHDVLVHWIDKYLADTSSSWVISLRGLRTVFFAVSGQNGPTAVNGSWCFAVRRRTTSARFWTVTPTPEAPRRRNHYEINVGKDAIRLDLPGCDDPTGLEMVYDWVHSCRTNASRVKLAQLETSKTRLEDLWLEAPTLAVRDRSQAGFGRVDTEVSRLKHGMVDLGKLRRRPHDLLQSSQAGEGG